MVAIAQMAATVIGDNSAVATDTPTTPNPIYYLEAISCHQ